MTAKQPDIQALENWRRLGLVQRGFPESLAERMAGVSATTSIS
jgi:hypothetical protein